MEGGLRLQDVSSQNLSLGGKILWKIVSGKLSWSKEVIWKKYFHGSRLKCLDRPPKVLRGSPIFNLCLKALDFFKKGLTWIPGNGKHIKIWEDSILGEPPLCQQEGMVNLKNWILSINYNMLWDILVWEEDEEGLWMGWELGNYSKYLKFEADLLL